MTHEHLFEAGTRVYYPLYAVPGTWQSSVAVQFVARPIIMKSSPDAPVAGSKLLAGLQEINRMSVEQICKSCARHILVLHACVCRRRAGTTQQSIGTVEQRNRTARI
jgi:hypothetical protein